MSKKMLLLGRVAKKKHLSSTSKQTFIQPKTIIYLKPIETRAKMDTVLMFPISTVSHFKASSGFMEEKKR